MNEMSENLGSIKGWESSGTDSLDALSDFGRGLVYGAIESPTNGVTQLVNAAIEPLCGSKIGKLDITGLEGDLMTGQCNTLSAEVGASLGGVVPLYAVNKVSGKLLGNSMGAAKTAEILGTAPSRAVVFGSLRQAMLTGAITGGVFTPTPEGEDLLEGRMKSASVGAVNFAVFNTFNEMGRSVLGRTGQIGSASTSQFLARELPLAVGVGAAAGAGSGVISANIDSLVYGQRFATSEEMTKRVLMDGIMGGGFALAHQAHSRFVKAAPLSESQKQSLSFKTVDENDSSWVKLYEKSIPGAEREPIDSIRATMSRSRSHLAYDATARGADGQPLSTALRHESMKAQWANGEPLVSGVLNTAVAPNGKTLAFSFVELYAGRDYLKHDPAFMMAAYLGVDPNLQSAGLGAHYWNRQLLPSLREQFPKHIGLAVEIESSKGLPPDSQPQKRARFYKDRTGMNQLDLKGGYELPLFQPDDAPHYIQQRQIPKYLVENGLPAEDGPIPADLIWKSFSNEPVSGEVARNMVERIYHSGYGVEPATATRPGDPYLQERTSLIDGSRADLVVPMHLEPGPKVAPTGLRRALDGLGRTVNYFDGHGFAAGSITPSDID